jgi:hypothetical protein
MIVHHKTHWIAVALVAALGLLALEVAGQDTTAAGQFVGRPALAGAQAGQGAQAGPPQGGIGLQGSDGAQLNLQPPAIIREQMAQPKPEVVCADVPRISAAEEPLCLPQAYDERLERRLARLGIDAQQRGRM